MSSYMEHRPRYCCWKAPRFDGGIYIRGLNTVWSQGEELESICSSSLEVYRGRMDNCCSGCGRQHSLYGKTLQEITLHCSNCGVAVKHWSCYRHSCEVLIWTGGQKYACMKCMKAEFRLAIACGNNSSLLALSLSLELYYKCKRRLIAEEGYMLIELWRKARVSGTEFVRTAAKEAAAAACRASEIASDRVESAARNMMADLARNQARARASASVPSTPVPRAPTASGLTHRRPSRVQTPLYGQKENAYASSRVVPMQDRKESTALTRKHPDQSFLGTHTSQRRRGNRSSKHVSPLLCGCTCQ